VDSVDLSTQGFFLLLAKQELVRIIMFVIVAGWGGGIRCWDSFACLLLSLPRRLVSACSVRSVCFLGRNATRSVHACAHTHTHEVNNGLFLQMLEMSIRPLPCSDTESAFQRVPSPGPGRQLSWGTGSRSSNWNLPVPRPHDCAASLRELLEPNS